MHGVPVQRPVYRSIARPVYRPTYGVLGAGITYAQLVAGAGYLASDPPGISAGVTPGVTGVARTEVSGSANNGNMPGATGWPLSTTYTSATFVSEAEVLAFVTSGRAWAGGGSGTAASPYLIRNLFLYGFTSGNGDTVPTLKFDSPTGSAFHILIENVAFGTGDFNTNTCGTAYINLPVGSTVTFRNCGFDGHLSLGTSPDIPAWIEVVQGTVIFEAPTLRKLPSHATKPFILKSGVNAHVVWTDGDFGTGAALMQSYFFISAPSVAGGSLTINTSRFDYNDTKPIVLLNSGVAITVDGIQWNPSARAGGGPFLQISNAVIVNGYTEGFTCTNSDIAAGTVALALVGYSDPNAASIPDVSNISFRHVTFRRPTLPAGAVRLISMGTLTKTDENHCKNILFEWCKVVGSGVLGDAGEEALEIFRGTDVTVRYCYAEDTEEDAFEFVSPIRNNRISYCGGTNVKGNVVDFYANFDTPVGNAAWATVDGNQGGHSVDTIWGDCGGDGVIVDCVNHVTVRGTRGLDNSAGGYAAAPPAANVRLHCRSISGRGSLEGVTVLGPLATVGESWNGKPCLLTMEEQDQTTVSGTAAGGQAVVNVASGTNFTAGDRVRVQLATGVGFYSTVLSKNVNALTLTTNLPSDSANNGQVQRQVNCNPGNVSWSDGISAINDGSVWVVDSMAG